MDITCAVVMQTSAQKAIFEQWGQTLSTDWTHGTNNLGYHLGCLIATISTGRGVPGLNFFALHETAEIMCQILEFFEAKNKSWQQIWSFVIDKDFAEWRALEQCFPSTKVLLCQFHAFTY
uniref:ZSWIM1/3 RNaseH-like domain-containing protein n=1 Tax=Globisporangium ultimum (strain ATCC 200006 / CBS 805.95 / DAOM BR144) TaxID=431595 RepID=K3X1X0_GLOUD